MPATPTPHTETVQESRDRIAKEDADRQKKGLPPYTDAERAQLELDRAAAVKAGEEKAVEKAAKQPAKK